MDESREAGAPADDAPPAPGDAGTAGEATKPPAATGTRPARKPRHAKAEPAKKGSFTRELPILLGIAFVLALLIKTFLVQAFFIPSGSMEETLLIGDRVLVNKLVYKFRDIHRGEIVVFDGDGSFAPDPGVLCTEPRNALERARRNVGSLLGLGSTCEKDFIKRVIGLPGDRVACCDAQDRVTVNGVGIDEPYLFEDDDQPFEEVTVPEGRLFVMGDHRSRSSDSRAHIRNPDKGTIPTDKVIGRAFVVIWPLKHAKGLRVPASLEKTAEQQSLPAAPWPVAAAPPLLGLAGAVPLTLANRRLRLRRRARR